MFFAFLTSLDCSFFDSRTLPQATGLVSGNAVVARTFDGAEIVGTVHAGTTGTTLVVELEPNQPSVDPAEVMELRERILADRPQSIVFREFIQPSGDFSQFWLSLDLDDALAARVHLNGVEVIRVNTGESDSAQGNPPGTLSPLSRAYRLDPSALAGGMMQSNSGMLHRVTVELHSGAFANEVQDFNLRIEGFESVDLTAQNWLPLDPTRFEDGVRAIVGGNADVRSLADNYLIMRYQAADANHASWRDDGAGGNAAWSQWTDPQLAEGWIKRVLRGINPFNQRISDLFNNTVSTEVSLVAQAGPRWEGDVALNLDTINDSGLIEVYETVLGRGKTISIGSGINFGPANDALLLAAGYINDLYLILGNDAWVDAANPTIGIGTNDNEFGDIATALFSFRGQVPTVLDEELALLRGRDDFLLPGVELRPLYNRLPWNFTRGIDAGEVIYSLNYNIKDQDQNGVIDAEDALELFPQGHGDAYGHYLTALKVYYQLLLDRDFDWVPRSEAVTVLGRPVSIDYQDERKFASAAASLARAGRKVFDLTWRKDYSAGSGRGWEHFQATRDNTTTRSTPTTRHWGLDHWASRTGQGAYMNWVVGNAILPDQDPDPTHAGTIQQIDRTTVPELKELVALSDSLQNAMDNAEAGHTPLGLPDSTIPFDLDPIRVLGGGNQGHFEQIFERATSALNNALLAFNDAKDVTRALRREMNTLDELRAQVRRQELAYTNALVELYGMPYPDDIGPGRTYRSGYAGPDLLHYAYVETPETATSLLDPGEPFTIRIDTQTLVEGWVEDGISDFNFITRGRSRITDGQENERDPDYVANTNLYVPFTLQPHGFFGKPESWNSRRAAPGRIQQAISDIIKARNAAYVALYEVNASKSGLDWALASFDLKNSSRQTVLDIRAGIFALDELLDSVKLVQSITQLYLDQTKDTITALTDAAGEALPDTFIAGLSNGGDLSAPAKFILEVNGFAITSATNWKKVIGSSLVQALEFATTTTKRSLELFGIAHEQRRQEMREDVTAIRSRVFAVQESLPQLNQRLQELDDARRRYRALLAEGDRIQQEREVFRQRAAAQIQGFRTRDAAFRIFRNEKLERYKTLFDLAAQYAFMAAQAFDYDTGLLHTDQGREFVQRIIRSRALGVIQGGQPQFAGSDTGDPGLSSALAEMWADWSVLKGRLGFNNPDGYGTTVSLRTENYRILPDDNGDENWKTVLNEGRMDNILDDPDVRRYCLQVDGGDGLPVPGIVLDFGTVIAQGLNLFGHPLAAGDHAYSPSTFATKIHAAGVALEGYVGLDDPAANAGAVAAGGGESPADPSLAFLNPGALAANPYIYLIPTGVDSMRSPPLGDASVVRTWSVDDVSVPLPFNIGGSGFSTGGFWQSAESLVEPRFSVRKHQAFRPVSSASVFETGIYSNNGSLRLSQFTNNRLIGRSIWNSQWKLVIPGYTLLNNPNEGLERFIRSVRDIKLHLVTYSYAGN